MTTHDSQLAEFEQVPVIDVGPLLARSPARYDTARQLSEACRESGFFYIMGHHVEPELLADLDRLSREFFRLPLAAKQQIAMSRGGRAWRGYFAVGDELTSGKPDQKEGLYFGAELPADHPEVVARTPLHGANLFPAELPELRRVVLTYMDRLTQLGHALMRGLSLSLNLPEDYFDRRYTADPLILFRIFNYPWVPESAAREATWGVGEHTDYGLLTILWQDNAGGLQVKSRSRWIEAPPIAGSFICNIGDMLDRLTRGLYRSTPHRVRNSAGRDRLSFPLFFDPSFRAEVRPIEELADVPIPNDRNERWDQASVHEAQGTYGDYLLGKVSKVFPQLRTNLD
ncbi:MAG: hypothetical protein K1X74_05780 [Pirellulales bacterium]|nr:hypothetical protein [Pirellulales bacterium]